MGGACSGLAKKTCKKTAGGAYKKKTCVSCSELSKGKCKKTNGCDYKKKQCRAPRKQKEKSNVLVPIPIRGFFLRATVEEWDALPCGEVRIYRERIDNPVFAKKKEDGKKEETIDWTKMAKRIQE